MKKKIIIGGLILMAMFATLSIGAYRRSKVEAYAKMHNCEWKATGSFYGDDRDFVCIKKGDR